MSKRPASKALKALKRHGSKTTNTREALKRTPTVSVLGIRRQRKNLVRLFKDDKEILKEIRPFLHRSFGSVDEKFAGMADPLERERNRLAFECLISRWMREKCYRSVFHMTLALPQHMVDYGELSRVQPNAVRRKFEDTMRDLRKQYPDAFSAGFVEVQGLYVNRRPIWSAHLHALVFNLQQKDLHRALKFRKINSINTPYRPLVCILPNDEFAPLTWSNYITKFRVSGSIRRRRSYLFKPANGSDNSMPLPLKREIAHWYSQFTVHHLSSFVGVQQATVKQFYGADLESILTERYENWKHLLGNYYRY